MPCCKAPIALVAAASLLTLMLVSLRVSARQQRRTEESGLSAERM